MSLYGEERFYESLKKEPEDRDSDDHQIIYSYLHGLEALSSLREASLRTLCKTVRYEAYEAN
ncbi:Rap guanine nucleotide exchange factor 6, partial [Stegodyphus mimosarum]